MIGRIASGMTPSPSRASSLSMASSGAARVRAIQATREGARLSTSGLRKMFIGSPKSASMTPA